MARDELALRDTVIVDDPRDQEIDRLKRQMRQLERDLADAERGQEHLRDDAQRSLSMLRKQLSPLYLALQAVFGELDAAGITDAPLASDGTLGHDSRTAAVWASWKQKLGAAGKLIDALLLHREMNTQQLAIATGLHRTTIPKHIYALNKAGLINKNSGRFSLKTL